MNNYKEVFNSYLKSIFSKNFYNNNMNLISNILLARKCYSCDENIYIFKLECGLIKEQNIVLFLNEAIENVALQHFLVS